MKNRSGGGTIKLLDDVDLTIQPNEFVGLLGPSGAGKSTLMDSLNGMRPATSGHVLINNLDLVPASRFAQAIDWLRSAGRHHSSRADGLSHALLRRAPAAFARRVDNAKSIRSSTK